MYRNEKDRTGRASWKGAKAEVDFKNSLDGFFGSDLKLTGVDDGQFDHIDFVCELNMKVDVKAIKDPSSIWVELKNIKGYDGWLYGKATHIAFERHDHFKVVRRLDLVELVDKLVDKTTMVELPKDCLYKIYQRKKYDRDDMLTKILPSDLDTIQNVTVKKEDSATVRRKDKKESVFI